jgi:hypothetical protein
LVFIILSGLGTVWVYFYIPETKGIPLEEMGRLFGDNVAVREADPHLDHTTNVLVVQRDTLDGGRLHNVATEAGMPVCLVASSDMEEQKHGHIIAEHLENVHKA